MRTAKRTRYYCDHCTKSTGTRPSMEKHEKGCTANPNRVCGLCEHVGETQRPISELVTKAAELFGTLDWQQCYGGPAGDKAMAAFREFANHCPACILAAFRQGDPMLIAPNFQFREELRDWWKETNAARGEYP